MCNEKEGRKWFVDIGKPAINELRESTHNDTTDALALAMCPATAWAPKAGWVPDTSMHDDSGVGNNRKFDPAMVADVDKVYLEHWNQPEYLPFRECIKMAIQDGIIAGTKRTRDKYEPVIAQKNARIEELHRSESMWRISHKIIQEKCKEGLQIFDFLSDLAKAGTSD